MSRRASAVLSESEMVRASLLLGKRQRAWVSLNSVVLTGLREGIPKDYICFGSEDYENRFDPSAKALIDANIALVEWYDAKIAGRNFVDVDEGIPGCKFVGIVGVDADSVEEFFRWEHEGYEWLALRVEPGDDLESLLQDPLGAEEKHTLNCLIHAAETGWPLFTKRQAARMTRVVSDLKVALDLFGGAEQHVKRPTRGAR